MWEVFQVVKFLWKPVGFVVAVVGVINAGINFAHAADRYLESNQTMMTCIQDSSLHHRSDDLMKKCVNPSINAESELLNSALELDYQAEKLHLKLQSNRE